MRKFTDAELELAPKVAEVMGHNPESGDYYFYAEIPKVYLVDSDVDIWTLSDIEASTSHWLPLEHDCLEWLREREYKLEVAVNPLHSVRVEVYKLSNGHWRFLYGVSGDALLEALYHCIIEVGG